MSAVHQVPVDRPVRRREATPDRWQRALERATLANVQVRQLQGSGQWVVTSASQPDAAYETDGTSCTCPAAQLGGDPICLHRAAYWHAQGALDRDPDPTPPAAPCQMCGGSRVVGIFIHNWRRGESEWVGDSDCSACNGSGVEPTAELVAWIHGKGCHA